MCLFTPHKTVSKIVGAVFILFISFSGFSQDTTALYYSKFISGSIIQKHLSVLASDSMEGRETAHAGMIKATKYVADQFKGMGMAPINDGSYFQKIPLLDLSKTISSIQINKNKFTNGDDYFVYDASTSMELLSTEIVFAGFGITDSISKWDDYINLDVAGKIILILDKEPVNKKGKSLISGTKDMSSWNSDRLRKIKLAKSKGVKAILFVNYEYEQAYERYKKRMEYGRMALDLAGNENNIPVIYLTKNAADRLLNYSGKSIAAFSKTISKKKKPVAIKIDGKAEINISIEKTSCNNVLGFVEGSTQKDEVLIISAHLDHLGMHEGKIFYGADDDGSGSASLLALAETFAKAKKEGHGPSRSILLMTFTGEEKGLLGSEYYASNPVFPLDKIVADLNIDMIGRVDTVSRASNRYTYIIGSDKLSSQLHAINEMANKNCCQLELDYTYNDPSDKLKLYYRSDHYNFAKHNIPVIFYFTGLHEDYHKPTDTIDKIDFDKTAAIARLVFNTAWEIANRKDRITVDVVNDFK